jgi:hypothetical protein
MTLWLALQGEAAKPRAVIASLTPAPGFWQCPGRGRDAPQRDDEILAQADVRIIEQAIRIRRGDIQCLGIGWRETVVRCKLGMIAKPHEDELTRVGWQRRPTFHKPARTHEPKTQKVRSWHEADLSRISALLG